MQDLKTFLDHELLHFEITKKPAKFEKSYNITKAQFVSNILEDIIINEKLKRSSLERVYKKMTGDKEKAASMITLWGHFTDEEKRKVVEEGLKKGIFKDKYTVDEIIETIEYTIKERKSENSLYDFVEWYDSTFKKFYNLFRDDTACELAPSNGPAEYDSSYNKPDWNLFKEISKILQRFKIKTQHTTIEKKFYGKRLNRKFYEDPSEIYPFKHKYTKTQIRKPKILCILDCSGSM